MPSVVMTAKGFGREKRSRLTRPLAASTWGEGECESIGERGWGLKVPVSFMEWRRPAEGEELNRDKRRSGQSCGVHTLDPPSGVVGRGRKVSQMA